MNTSTILKISECFSAGVTAENLAQAKNASDHLNMLAAANVQEYIESGISVAPIHYSMLLPLLPNRPLAILDVGVGLGESSVFLASKGHEVFSVEPNEAFCSIIHRFVQKCDLPIKVCNGVGEDIHNIGKYDFDAVFFHESLHHCDSPILALTHAFNSLRPGGRIFLVNENFLRPWTSKANYQHLLNTDPVGMGHYGGNEHAYHNWEYSRLLNQAGYSDIRRLPPFDSSALEKLEHILSKRIAGERVYQKGTQIFTRLAYYMLEEKIRKSDTLFQLLSQVSILAAHFTAVK